MKRVSFSSNIQQQDCSHLRENEEIEDKNEYDESTWLLRSDYKRMAKREWALLEGLRSGDIHFNDEFLITNGLESPTTRQQKHIRIREGLLAVLSEQQLWNEEEKSCNALNHDEELAIVSLATTRKSATLARERGIALENFVLNNSNQNWKKESPQDRRCSPSGCTNETSNNGDVAGQQKQQQQQSSHKTKIHQRQGQSGLSLLEEPTATKPEEEMMSTIVSAVREGRWQSKDMSLARLIAPRKPSVAVA